MINKYIQLTTILFIALFNIALAQDDDASVFHKASKDNKTSSSSGADEKFAVYFNPGFALRGGATIGAQWNFFDGLAVSFDYGKSIDDFMGKLSLQSDYLTTLDGFSTKTNNGFGNIFEYGLKYYTSHAMDGFYMSVGYASISNSTKRTITSYYTSGYNYNIYNGQNSYILDYHTNDYKFMFGYTGAENSKIFVDYSIGFGYRTVNNPYLTLNTDSYTTNNGNYSYVTVATVAKKANLENKLWMFFGLKIGAKF